VEGRITSQGTTLLKVIHALARIALAQFLANETRHHTAHPLLANDRVAGIVDCDVVLEVDALVGRGDGGLFGQEGGGLGGGHFVERTRWVGNVRKRCGCVEVGTWGRVGSLLVCFVGIEIGGGVGIGG
jgi:hypothetical protein